MMEYLLEKCTCSRVPNTCTICTTIVTYLKSICDYTLLNTLMITNLIGICLGFSGLYANQGQSYSSPEDGGKAPESIW